MPNKKGGYKIVSLKNINLLGVSLSLAGLYKALNDSYGKPIQICDINFNGTKKKDAFVLVEKLDAGVKINDLYGYDILVESDDDITVTANPQELPDTSEASEGQVLKLNAQKKPEWASENELPATASATAGQILGLDADKNPEWQDKPASGTKLYLHKSNITISNSGGTCAAAIISTSPTQYTSIGQFGNPTGGNIIRTLVKTGNTSGVDYLFSWAYYNYQGTNKVAMIGINVNSTSPDSVKVYPCDDPATFTDTVTEL